jgi:hypothetical protein
MNRRYNSCEIVDCTTAGQGAMAIWTKASLITEHEYITAVQIEYCDILCIAF